MTGDSVGLLRLMVSVALLAIGVIGVAYAERHGRFAKFLASIAVFGSLIVISLAVAVFAKDLGLFGKPTPTVTSARTPTPPIVPSATASPTEVPLTEGVCAGVPASEIRHLPNTQHKVVRGETLSSIAADYGVSVQELKEANKEIHPELYSNPDCLREGIWLIIPDPR